MAEFAQLLGEPSVIPAEAGIHGRRPPSELYDTLAERTRAGFARFWNEEAGYCYDLLDSPEGNDPALRPNQLFAVSLPHSPLPPEQQKAVVDACARRLLTSHGLRSLDPRHPDYRGHHGADRRTRDAAYHQGTVWGWLIGPFVSAHLRMYRDPAPARSFLWPLIPWPTRQGRQELDAHCVGSLSEIFDGDPPHTPRGCIAQAWTVAEVLRVWKEIEQSLPALPAVFPVDNCGFSDICRITPTRERCLHKPVSTARCKDGACAPIFRDFRQVACHWSPGVFGGRRT
jgi:glycogen debranching enzyme